MSNKSIYRSIWETLSGEERGIGGLGIFMVKRTMDNVSYAYEEGKNVLTIQKKL